MRRLAKGVVFGGLLRWIVQKADNRMGLVGKEREGFRMPARRERYPR
jgi:hypothetical protein